MRGVPRYADLMISSIGEISRERVFKSPLGHSRLRVDLRFRVQSGNEFRSNRRSQPWGFNSPSESFIRSPNARRAVRCHDSSRACRSACQLRSVRSRNSVISTEVHCRAWRRLSDSIRWPAPASRWWVLSAPTSRRARCSARVCAGGDGAVVVAVQEQERRGVGPDQIDRVGLGGPVPVHRMAWIGQCRAHASSNPSARTDRSEAPNSSTTARIRGSARPATQAR